MIPVLIMLTVQTLLGAFDNLWHHEITERLPQKPWARRELALHTAREFLYAVIFTGVAWFRWEGLWCWALLGILAVEIAVTLTDFVIEDRTRKLPSFERVLHTVLAINFGAILAVWAPELARWAARPTALVGTDYGLWSWLFTAFGVGVLAWAVRDLRAVVRLGVPEWQRDPIRAGTSRSPRRVLVTGATGFIGRAVVRALVERGDTVTALSRDPRRARDILGPLVYVVGDLDEIGTDWPIDAIVNLAGESIPGGLWTERRRQVLINSRVGVTEAVARLVHRLHDKPAVVVNASAIGYYGDRGSELLTEASSAQDIFMSKLCRRWEAAAMEAEGPKVRVCRLRIGFVLGQGGGALPALARPVRFGLGARFGAGKQWISWIHLADLVDLILFAIETPAISGPVNAVSPEPVPHGAFMQAIGNVLRRPVALTVPAGLLRLGLGELSSLFLASQRVVPAAAMAAGFRFRFATLDAALADLLVRREAERAGVPTAYLNEACTVCSAQLGLCERIAARSGTPFRLQSIGFAPDALAAYGLREDEIRRRLFVADREGRLRSGVDAVLLLWRPLPYFRHLARLIAWPGIRDLAELIYEGLLVPILYVWNRRRAARRLSHGLG